MSAGDRGDPRPLSPQGRPSLTGTGHPVHAFVLPRRSVRAAEWYQSEPPAPCGVQTAACVKPSPPAGGGGCRRKAAGGASRNACPWTNLRSPRGGGANTEGFLALRCDRANHLGAQGGSRSHRWFSEGASYDEPQSRGSRRTPPRHGAARNGVGRGGERPALASCLLAHAAEHLHQSPTRELGTLPPEENH